MSQRSARTAGFSPALLLGAILVLAACQPLGQDAETTPPSATGDGAAETEAAESQAAATLRLTIATGGTGGVYFPLGGELALLLTENIEGVQGSAQETSASVDNMLLIGSGDADIAFVLGDTAADAVEGRGEDFEGAAIDACTLGILYSNFTQLVTTADSGIASVEDLRGKRVSVGAPGSGTEIIALRILQAAGID
ncbi:MAG: TAXI family TRAP transporter solute-binding subunit, partial [Chloroflexi bacterium]|nr:TAXI family TRAP transporter solute-binding subunit [Chloroflexota bacterium]